MEDQNVFVKIIVYFVTGIILYNITMYVIGLIIALVEYIEEKREFKKFLKEGLRIKNS